MVLRHHRLFLSSPLISMAMKKARTVQPLSLEEIASFRSKLLQNAASLICDGELLFAKGRHARCFTLCVLSIEESSKVLILLRSAEALVAGDSVDWFKIHASLVSHVDKLMENLINTRELQSLHKVPNRGTTEWEDAVARVRQMNGFKQDGLYVSLSNVEASTPDEKSGTFSSDRAAMVIELAKNSYNRADLMSRGFDARQRGQTTVDLRVRFASTSDCETDSGLKRLLVIARRFWTRWS